MNSRIWKFLLFGSVSKLPQSSSKFVLTNINVVYLSRLAHVHIGSITQKLMCVLVPPWRLFNLVYKCSTQLQIRSDTGYVWLALVNVRNVSIIHVYRTHKYRFYLSVQMMRTRNKSYLRNSEQRIIITENGERGMLPEQWTGNNLQWEQWTENKKEARTLHGNTPYPPPPLIWVATKMLAKCRDQVREGSFCPPNLISTSLYPGGMYEWGYAAMQLWIWDPYP